MNEWLAQMYGTNGANSEEQEKVASLDLFAKLAAQHNIDLSQLSDQQVSELYAETFPELAKTAEEDEDKAEEDKDDDEEEKKESAAHYVQEKLAFQEKVAEADFMGRVMAHSFTQEREKIARGIGAAEANRFEKNVLDKRRAASDAAKYEGPAKAGGGYNKGSGGTDTARSLVNKGKMKATAAGKAIKGFAGTRTGKLVGAGLGAAALAGGGYAAHKGLKDKEKKSSAQVFEELAANHAVKVASAAGFDSEEAFNRINAVYTLGLQETEKVASVQSVDDAIHVRGLEYLESAGYPVDWSEIFG